jgi:transposase-like protein
VHSLWKHAETTRWAHPPRRAALALHRLPSTLHGALVKRFLRPRLFADEIVTLAVRWYVRYRLSYADVAELLAERGVMVSRSTLYRWVQRFLPLFAEAARRQLLRVEHRCSRYLNNALERDHGHLKQRLRPMRGFKQLASADTFSRGHALIQNLRNAFSTLTTTVPRRLRLLEAWPQLGQAI